MKEHQFVRNISIERDIISSFSTDTEIHPAIIPLLRTTINSITDGLPHFISLIKDTGTLEKDDWNTFDLVYQVSDGKISSSRKLLGENHESYLNDLFLKEKERAFLNEDLQDKYKEALENYIAKTIMVPSTDQKLMEGKVRLSMTVSPDRDNLIIKGLVESPIFKLNESEVIKEKGSSHEILETLTYIVNKHTSKAVSEKTGLARASLRAIGNKKGALNPKLNTIQAILEVGGYELLVVKKQ